MAKHGWLLMLIAIAAFSFFNHFLISQKNKLTAVIQLEALEEPQVFQDKGREALVAQVYSTYPFNHRNLLSINGGARNQVKPGLSVTIDGKFLLGQVIESLERLSVVRTIFDKDFSLPVRLGDEGINALLAGGQSPRLTLIEKNARIKEGDLVYSAGRDFPYGLKIGTVGIITDSLAKSFKEAVLDLPYQMNNLQKVVVLIGS